GLVGVLVRPGAPLALLLVLALAPDSGGVALGLDALLPAGPRARGGGRGRPADRADRPFGLPRARGRRHRPGALLGVLLGLLAVGLLARLDRFLHRLTAGPPPGARPPPPPPRPPPAPAGRG